jgi:hypothetical protein
LLFCTCAGTAAAHEVQDAVADFVTEHGRLEMVLSLGIEPIIAGIDLENVTDTNDADGTEDVDALRALPPDALEPRLREALPRLIAGMALRANGTPLDVKLRRVTIPPVGNIELPRESTLYLESALPPQATTLEVTWPAAFGSLILRQMQVESAYTGYLAGESSGPIPIDSGSAQGVLGRLGGFVLIGLNALSANSGALAGVALALFFFAAPISGVIRQGAVFLPAAGIAFAAGYFGLAPLPAFWIGSLCLATLPVLALWTMVSNQVTFWRLAAVAAAGLLHGLGLMQFAGDSGLLAADGIVVPFGVFIGAALGVCAVIALAALLTALARAKEHGAVAARVAQLVYAGLVLGLIVSGLVFDTPHFVNTTGVTAPVVFWPLAVIAMQCLTFCFAADRPDAYRRIVAVPLSLGLALWGVYALAFATLV